MEPIASDLRCAAGQMFRTLKFDATDFSSHRKLYEGLEIKPDVVIAAFGYMSDQDEVRNDLEDIRRTIDINFTGMASILSVVAADFEKRGERSHCCDQLGVQATAAGRATISMEVPKRACLYS